LKEEGKLLHFPIANLSPPLEVKVDLYDSLSRLIKNNIALSNRIQVWLLMSWFMDEILKTRSFFITSEKLNQAFVLLNTDANKFLREEMSIFSNENLEKYRTTFFKVCVEINDEEDRQNTFGLLALILYVHRNNL